MELEELIKEIKADLEDNEDHKTDYCYFEIENVRGIIEYLEQLNVIAENKENER